MIRARKDVTAVDAPRLAAKIAAPPPTAARQLPPMPEDSDTPRRRGNNSGLAPRQRYSALFPLARSQPTSLLSPPRFFGVVFFLFFFFVFFVFFFLVSFAFLFFLGVLLFCLLSFFWSFFFFCFFLFFFFFFFFFLGSCEGGAIQVFSQKCPCLDLTTIESRMAVKI